MSDGTEAITHYERQFGLIAIGKGFITKEDLLDALSIQIQEDLGLEPHRQVGAILLSLGKMDPGQIEEVVKETVGDGKV